MDMKIDAKKRALQDLIKQMYEMMLGGKSNEESEVPQANTLKEIIKEEESEDSNEIEPNFKDEVRKEMKSAPRAPFMGGKGHFMVAIKSNKMSRGKR